MGKAMLVAFKKQLDLMSSESLKDHVVGIMLELDDYNIVGPSSSSGRFHPPEDNKVGGNYNHTINVLYCALKLANSIPQFDDPAEKDIIIASALLHDMCKYHSQEYDHTHFDHPLQIRNEIADYVRENSISEEDQFKLARISDCVVSHMSRWNTDKRYPGIELPIPTKVEHLILSFADILSADRNVHLENPLGK